MNIDKAIKKQNAKVKRFTAVMLSIFIGLPIILYVSKQISIFFTAYLALIEALILLLITYKLVSNELKYKIDSYRIKILFGFPQKDLRMFSERVQLVHTENDNYDMKLILVGKDRSRSQYVKPIEINFLKANPYVGYYYSKLKQSNPENDYFYTIIRSGGYKKYPLLNDLYKYCTNSIFTDEAIEQIKKYRNVNE
ncbi:MAG: hypothetical protein PHX70_01850 [Clostridium sp.]|nr:hypothetical protein [Clostridium sp.]